MLTLCGLAARCCLAFGEAQIIGGIVPNLIAFGLFIGAIGFFALTGKMADMFDLKKPSK